jgi:hypothetical protein
MSVTQLLVLDEIRSAIPAFILAAMDKVIHDQYRRRKCRRQ